MTNTIDTEIAEKMVLNIGSAAQISPRILMVDAHTMVRCSLRALLEQAHLCVVGEAATAQEALRCLQNEAAEIVLLGLLLKNESGNELIPPVPKASHACLWRAR